MWAFFHGWRRKAGCITLGMGCMVMGMWIGSRVSIAFMHIPVDTNQSIILGCTRSGIGCYVFDIPLNFELEFVDPDYHWPAPDPREVMAELSWIAPYWSLILPLTLLSAYLILWKPRKRI